MRRQKDPLYLIFEHHLLNCLVENEGTDDFIKRVVQEYIELLNHAGRVPPQQMLALEADLRDEVLEMVRKKTYGHYSLAEFRKTIGIAPANAPTTAAEKPVTRIQKNRPAPRRRSC